MKYVSQAKKCETTAVCEPLYSAYDKPTTAFEWNALKDDKAVNTISVEKEDDLFAMAKKSDSDFEDLQGRIVDLVVCIPLDREAEKYKVITQTNVEVVGRTSMPGIVFRNPVTGDAINVYKGVVKMFQTE